MSRSTGSLPPPKRELFRQVCVFLSTQENNQPHTSADSLLSPLEPIAYDSNPFPRYLLMYLRSFVFAGSRSTIVPACSLHPLGAIV